MQSDIFRLQHTARNKSGTHSEIESILFREYQLKLISSWKKMMPNNTHPSLPLRLKLSSNLNAAAQAHSPFCKIQLGNDESDTGDTARMSGAKNATIGYNDYSSVKAPEVNDAAVFSPQSVSGKEPTFPVKLHMILANPEFQDIIAWLPHGRSWRIIQQKAFEERVLPLYFRHGRYSSFARQVNGWGFRRVTHGSDYNSYYHEVRCRSVLVSGRLTRNSDSFLSLRRCSLSACLTFAKK